MFSRQRKKKKKRTWTKGNGQIDLALLSNKMISDKRKMNRVVIKMQNVKLTRFSRVVEMELEWNEMEQVRDNKVDMLSEDNEYEELTD